MLKANLENRAVASAKTTHKKEAGGLHYLAFDHSFQANIISEVKGGKIITANKAAVQLLGYSKKELLTKKRADLFDVTEPTFKKLLRERKADGKSAAVITVFKKNGKSFPAAITSAIFTEGDGAQKAISTIADLSESIRHQSLIDAGKEKVVADNITLAKSKQKKLDQKNKKKVAHNIEVAQAKSDSRFHENNEWIKRIAKASYDVMWDWDIASGEIYVGDSIHEVFGYSVPGNTTGFVNFISCLLPGEKRRVKEKLSNALASSVKSWNDSFGLKRSDGSLAAAASRASIVRDEKGAAIRMIGAIKDVSQLQQLKQQLDLRDLESEKFFLAAKLSFDVIWEWNVITNEIFMGEGFQELFGFDLNNQRQNFRNWGDHLHPDDREIIEESLYAAIASGENHWEKTYRIIRADGCIANVLDRATIIRHTDGKAYRMIGALQDISRQMELEEKLAREIATKGKMLMEYNERFQLIFNSSSDILYDIDLITNEIILSDAYEKYFGYKITGNMTQVKDWADHIHMDDKEAVIRNYMGMLNTGATEWKYNYRFVKADGSSANVLSSAIILRTKEGVAYRMIGSMQDVSRQTVLEDQLQKEVRLKEKQIEDAMQQAKETERSDIGRELHDNVNQLLGVSRLYLDMAKRGGSESQMYLSRSSEYTMNAIEEIRKLTKGLTTDTIKNLGLCEAIENLVQDTMQVNPVKISCSLENFSESSVDDKFKLNLYRILQEQLNNILKHAKASLVTIELGQDLKTTRFTITDNGIGFNTGQKRKGIGLDNIQDRAVQFDGQATFISSPKRGCTLLVEFPSPRG
jgi:PAS domain S-box-containing protein